MFKLLEYPEVKEAPLVNNIEDTSKIPYETLLSKRKEFTLLVPNDNYVPSRFLVCSGQEAKLRRIQQTLIMQSNKNDLGGKCFGPFTRPKTEDPKVKRKSKR